MQEEDRLLRKVKAKQTAGTKESNDGSDLLMLIVSFDDCDDDENYSALAEGAI